SYAASLRGVNSVFREADPPFADEFGKVGAVASGLRRGVDVRLLFQSRQWQSTSNQSTPFVQQLVHPSVEQDAPVEERAHPLGLGGRDCDIRGAVVGQRV